MDAEDVQRPLADGLHAVGDEIVHMALEEEQQRQHTQTGHRIQQDAHGAEGPFGHRDAVGALGGQHKARHSQRRGDHAELELPGQGPVEDLVLLGQIPDVERRNRDHALADAEGDLPGDADAPAQQHGAQHGPGYVWFGEDVQDDVQQDPRDHQREQIPHRPAGEEGLPGVDGGMGQAQRKTAEDLEGLSDSALDRAEGEIVDEKMEERRGKPGIKVGLEQRFELLVDALADGPLAEAVAAGDVERRHQ